MRLTISTAQAAEVATSDWLVGSDAAAFVAEWRRDRPGERVQVGTTTASPVFLTPVVGDPDAWIMEVVGA